MRKIVIILVGGLLLIACSIARWNNVPVGPMMNPGSGWWNGESLSSNGERIYFTATNDRGQRIPYSGGPFSGGMMMGMDNYVACASCHGAEGRGGLHTMHMNVMDAPDIRFVALSGEADKHTDDHGGDDHADAHSEYDLDTFRRAVVEGRHPNGESLSRKMPRWRMNDEDLGDLFEYLKTLD